MQKANFTNWLAIFVISMCFGYLFWVSKMDMAGKVTNNISEIKMSVINLLQLCVGYFFVTTASSKKKDETISDALKQTNVTPANISNVEQLNVTKSVLTDTITDNPDTQSTKT